MMKSAYWDTYLLKRMTLGVILFSKLKVRDWNNHPYHEAKEYEIIVVHSLLFPNGSSL